MRDGSQIQVGDMSDKHLLNSLAMLERNGHSRISEYALCHITLPQGEMACMAVDVEIDAVLEGREDAPISPMYAYMFKHAKKRGLVTVGDEDVVDAHFGKDGERIDEHTTQT